MKKLLALVLALVMTMGLATISSNAAFNDESSIQHKEAVSVMSSLGIIEGKTDGNFDPNGNVTRAEMAKMVAMTMLGSETDASAFTGAPTDLNDINGHWAEGWIKYCISQGIVAGRGNNTFAPSENVTAAQAAKMLLVAIGYNSDVQQYVGSQWKVNVARDAQLSGFYKQLNNLGADKVLTRDEAAQMIYNAADCKQTVKTDEISRSTGEVSMRYTAKAGFTLLEDTFKVTTIGDSNDWFVSRVKYQKDGIHAGKYLTQLVCMDNYTVKYADGTEKQYNAGNTTTFYADTDTSPLLYQYAIVRWQDRTDSAFTPSHNYNGQKDTVLSAVAKYEGSSTDEYYWADTDRDSDRNIKLGGTIYHLDENVMYYVVDEKGDIDNGTLLSTTTNNNLVKSLRKAVHDQNGSALSTIRLIDANMDGDYETAIIKAVYATKVSYVSGGTVVTNAKTWKADDVVADGLAKDDYVSVQYSFQDDKTLLTKLEKQNGTVTSTSDSKDEWSVRIDGNSYLFVPTANTSGGYGVRKDFAGQQNLDADSSYDYYVVNGVIVYAEVTSAATVDNIVFVSGKGNNNNLNGDQVKVYFLDGTTRTVTIDDSNYKAGGSMEYTNFNGVAIGEYYRVSETSKGYRFYPITYKTGKSAVLADYYFAPDAQVERKSQSVNDVEYMYGYIDGGNKSISIEDSARIFVYAANENTVKVITGKQLKSMTVTVGTTKSIDTGMTATMFAHKVNGVYKISYAAVQFGQNNWNNWDGTFTTNEHFAVVLSKPVNIANGYVEYKIWDGKEETTVVDRSSKGSVNKFSGVSYSYINNDGEIEDPNVKAIDANSNFNHLDFTTESYGAVAITGFNKVSGGYELYVSNDANGNTARYKTDDDTIWLYIDSDNTTGIADADAALATADNNYDTDIPNALIWVKDAQGTDKANVNLVVIDVTNRLTKDASNKVKITGTGGYRIYDSDNNEVFLNDSVKTGDILRLEDGVAGTFTYNTNVNSTGHVTLNAGANAAANMTVVVNGLGDIDLTH